jgi:hypothetical protein
MKVLKLYRVLLCLYPGRIRREFAAEMSDVFGGLVKNRAAMTRPAFAFLILREFIGLLVGAAGAWMGVLLPQKIYFIVPIPVLSHYLARPSAEEAALTIPEMEERLKAAKANMFDAAGRRDFVTARSYAAKAARNELLLKKRARQHE